MSKIEITTTDEGVHVHAKMENASPLDRAGMLLVAFQALEIDIDNAEEAALFVSMARMLCKMGEMRKIDLGAIQQAAARMNGAEGGEEDGGDGD